MENVNGVFFVLFGGCTFAIILGAFQAVMSCLACARKVKVFPQNFLPLHIFYLFHAFSLMAFLQTARNLASVRFHIL